MNNYGEPAPNCPWYTICMTTTIKVSKETRDLLKTQASKHGQSLGAYLSHLAAEAERRARFAAMREAYASTPAELTESYWRETNQWLDADLGA